MKRHQCAEQQVSLSNLTKYCACHEKWHCKISKKISKNRWNVISNATPWSEHDPTMIRPWKRKPQPASQVRLLSELTTSIFYWKIQRFAPNLTNSNRLTKYCACHAKCHLNLTKYCACHAERLTYLVLITYETSFTVRGATGVTIQPHQILRLPRKMTRLLYRPHIWNVISNARSNRCHYPTSPNTAPATKNDTARFQRKSPKTDETSFPMRGRSEHDPTMIHDPTMKTQTATRLASEVTFRAHHEHFLLKNTTFRAQSYIQTFTKYCACHVKCHLNFTKYCACHAERLTYLVLIAYETSFTVRGATGVTIQPHQILRLPRKMTRLLYRPHIWNVISNARSNRCHHPTSPNTAPATKNDSTALSSSHMKRHFQCAEQQVSLSNLTKYCACHEKWHCKISKKISKNRWNVISNAGPIRPWSEHDPSMIRAWKRKPQPASQVRLLFELTTSIFYCKIQRFAPNLTFKPSPNTAPATKSDTWTSPSTAPATKSDTWTSPSTAPATKSDTWTSPSTAPATKSDTWTSPSTAPATKSDTWTSPSTAPATKSDTWTSPSTAPATKSDTWTSPSTAPATKSDTWTSPSTAPATKSDTWTSPSTAPATKSDTRTSTATLLELHSTTLLYLTLLYSDYWLYLTLLDSTDSTLLDSTWLYLTLLYSTWLYSTWLLDSASTWLDSTWLYLTLLWLYLFYLLYLTLLYSTLLDSTLLYLTLLDSASTWLYSTWLLLYLILLWLLLDSTWHYSTWLYLTLLDSTLLCLLDYYSTWLYLTLLTWLYSTWLLTLLDSTWLYSTWLYLTLLYLTLLDFNLTGMSFVYRKSKCVYIYNI